MCGNKFQVSEVEVVPYAISGLHYQLSNIKFPGEGEWIKVKGNIVIGSEMIYFNSRRCGYIGTCKDDTRLKLTSNMQWLDLCECGLIFISVNDT